MKINVKMLFLRYLRNNGKKASVIKRNKRHEIVKTKSILTLNT